MSWHAVDGKQGRMPALLDPRLSPAAKLAVIPRVQRELVPGDSFWDQVKDGLKQGLSPEQISGTLSRMNEPIRLSHETIYQAICVMPKGKLRTDTVASLRFGHYKRRPLQG